MIILDGSDNSGTYFIGEGKCVGVHIIDGNKSYSYTYKGGVWVPKAKRNNLKLFVINGSHLNGEEKAPYLNVKVVDALHPNNYSVENALGGAIGGAIINSLTQAEIGNIQTISEIIDEETISLVENAMK